MTVRRPVLLLLAGLAVAAGSARQAPVTAADTPKPAAGIEQDCLWQLMKGKGDEIACAHRAWLTDTERDDLRRVTRQLLQDATCTVSIRIERALVEAAVAAAGDHVFQSPPQPVACEITTRKSVFPISATFAPRVVFKAGVAVEATPGLADVEGVSRYLAWPVVKYVNWAPHIRTTMLQIINAYSSYIREHPEGAD